MTSPYSPKVQVTTSTLAPRTASISCGRQGFMIAEVMPDAIAMVTANPARQVGLEDRGRLAPGLRADLVRVGRQDTIPVVRQVWREGRRVA